jgi:ABC-type transport system substrate-binding protein
MSSNYWNQLASRRITRRRLLQGSAAAAVAGGAVWVVGCGSGAGRPLATPGLPPLSGNLAEPDILNPANPPRPGGRYAVSLNEPFDTFDPHLAVAGSTDFFPRLYNSLVHQSSSRPEFLFLDLAESYENPDELTWNFHIRPGARVAPNSLDVPERDLSAEDVVATFDRIRGDARTNNGAFVKQYVEAVTAQPGGIVAIRTMRPYAWFLSRVGSYFNTIVPRELIASVSAVEAMRERSAGAGPYVLASAVEGEGARIERNPSYYRRDEATGQQLPYIDGIDAKIITDRAAARTAFLSGQLHSYYPEGRAEADEIARDDRFYIEQQPGATFISIVMNPERPPFNDPRARRAIALATDRGQYADIVYQGDARPNGLVHWTLGSYAYEGEPLTERQPHDVAEARRLIEALGGLDVAFTYPANVSLDQHDAHLTVFLEQMKAAGISLDHQPGDLSTWLTRYAGRDYTLTLALNQVYETPEFPLDFHHTGGPLADNTYASGLSDPDVDAAIDLTKETLDPAPRKEVVLRAQDLIWSKDPAFLPLVTPFRYRAHSTRLRNMPSGIGTSHLWLTTMWLDQ